MSRDGSGTYSLPATMATSGATASSVTVNSIMNDIAQALTDSVNKDGTKAFAGNQSMGSNRLTSLAAGIALTDAVTMSQAQKGNIAQATTVAGTVDAITLAFTPTITSLTSGMRFRFVSAGANTVTTPTINIDGLGAKTVKKNPGAAALVAGDIGASGTVHECVYNGTDVILMNPVATYLTTTAAASTYLTSATAASTYAPLASPALTGNPTAPTASPGDNDTSIATTAFVTAAVAAGGSSMTLLATVATTSGSTQTASGLTLTGYKALYILANGVSLSGANGAFTIAGGAASVTLGAGSSGQTISSVVTIDLTTGIGSYYSISSGGTIVSPTAVNYGVTTATTSISIVVTGGTSFDLGQMLIYGVK